MRGDIDGDGKITENDRNRISEHLGGTITLTGADSWCAKVTGNNEISVSDLVQLVQYLEGKTNNLTGIPTFADYYNNWTYHKVDDLTGYWTAEVVINGLKTTSDAIVNISNDEGIFYKSELSDGAISFYAIRPPIAEVPATITFKPGTGVITTSYESAKFHASTHSKDGADPIDPVGIGATPYVGSYDCAKDTEIDAALDDMATKVENGPTVYGNINVTAALPSLLGGSWSIRVHAINSNAVDVFATMIGMPGNPITIRTRTKYAGTWGDWKTLSDDSAIVAALAKKAPSGFGVGEIVPDSTAIGTLAELDATEKGGLYYYYNGDEAIGSFPYGQYGMVLVLSTAGIKRQYFFPRTTDSRWWVRQKTDYADTWGEWEFGKVPMDLGVEYRTTERYLGYPVYVKLINLGSLPNAGSTKQISVRDFGIRVPISMDLTWGNFASENFTVNDYAPYVASAGFDNANINIVGGPSADTEHYEVYAFLKYSKPN